MFIYFSGLYCYGGSDDVRPVIGIAISEFALLVAVQFFLHVLEGAETDYVFSPFYFDLFGVGFYL